MSFLLRLVGAFLAACACVALAWVLGPAGLLLPAVVIVMVAFSEAQFQKGSFGFIVVIYPVLLISSVVARFLFEHLFDLSDQYEIIKGVIDYQFFHPVFSEKSFLEADGSLFTKNALLDNTAYLVSHLSLFLLVFLGVWKFGTIQKVLKRNEELLELEHDILAYFLLVILVAVLAVIFDQVYIQDYSPNYFPDRSTARSRALLLISLPASLFLAVFISIVVRRIFK